MAGGFIKDIVKEIIGPTRPLTEQELKIKRIENTQNEIKVLENKIFKEERDIEGIKFASKIMTMIFTFGGIIGLFQGKWILLLSAIFASAFFSEVFKFARKDTEKKIENLKMKVSSLRKILGENSENIFNKNMSDEDLKNGPVIDADIVTETREEVIESDQYLDSIPEAKLAFDRVDDLSTIIFSIGSHDNELYSLFKPAVEAAERTADLIQQDKNREKMAYKYYNYVEILYKWANDLNGLYSKDVYDSLLTNVKQQAKTALPNLQRKINDEYYKLINPTIIDLESEMEMMSNEL